MVEVVVLSRYREGKNGKFEEDTIALRNKFVNPQSDGYIFQYQNTKFNLPITDLPELSEKSWSSIRENKKLNLPCEKEQLANFRCSSIISEIEEEFEAEIKVYDEQKKSTNFGEMKAKLLAKYDLRTDHYSKKITQAKKSELENGIDDHLKRTVNNQVD